MRVLAGALLAALASGPDLHGAGNLAVTLGAQPLGHTCAIVSTATITAHDASTRPNIAYRFVRSDGTVSPTGRLTFAGDGSMAQSVRDQWQPTGAAPWVALEITAPERVRSNRVAVTPRCPPRVAAAVR
jgi:hypothetical protein